MIDEIKRFWRSLRGHPGVPIVLALMPMGFIAGASNPHNGVLAGGLFGAAVMSLFWIPVLITAWSGANNRQGMGDTYLDMR